MKSLVCQCLDDEGCVYDVRDIENLVNSVDDTAVVIIDE